MGAGSAPKPQKLPKPPPVEHDLAPEVLAARDMARQAAQRAAGRGGTILSGLGGGGMGLGGGNGQLLPYLVGSKSLLGGSS